jgi:predicted amidophosphoribosyltransferase
MGRFIESVAELVAPTRCAGCERQGVLFCEACRRTLGTDYAAEQVCPVCGGPYGALVCTECWDGELKFDATVALGVLDGPLARAVVLYKDGNERRLAGLLGEMLARRIREEWGGWGDVVTWIPASKRALKRRGFDHGELIAKAVAAGLGLPIAGLLQRPHSKDQRKLTRAERLNGSDKSFTCTTSPPATILLVDDVMTTGATTNDAAEALLGAGAAAVRVGVFARTW